MNLSKDIKNVYFIGAGGIGMSALARFMKISGFSVAGYDRVSTPLTDSLSMEGIDIHFEDSVRQIPGSFKNAKDTLVIYTPAIPEEHLELTYFRKNHFNILKRSQALGLVLRMTRGVAVAGTHGKTTLSSMIAHIMNRSRIGCNAFLGGISKNLNSNLLLSAKSEFTVVEADEYDRSFLQLFPEILVVTSIDPDHLDIYGNYENLLADFNHFISQVKPEGTLIYKSGLPVKPQGIKKVFTYSLNSPEADFYVSSFKRSGFRYVFNLQTPGGLVKDLELGVYGKVNLENAVGAIAAALQTGVSVEEIRKGIADYTGVKRRFDVIIERTNRIYIDDYAHHPEELKAFISSVKEALPDKILTGIFQPHLYSRTRDFAAGFAESLSVLDNVLLMDIYPAREKPIPGIDSSLIFGKLTNKGKKLLVKDNFLNEALNEINPEVLLTMGAGNIDQWVEPVKDFLNKLDQ